MKKSLGLFFFGIFTTALGIGFLSSSLKHSAQKVEAASDISYVKFDDEGIVRLGEYPQNIVTTVSADDIKTNGTVTTTTGGNKYYTYHNKKYAIIENAVVDTEGSSGRILSNGEAINNYNGQSNVVIEFNTIEWQLLKIDKNDTDKAYLISTNILDREIYNQSLAEHVDYYHSSLFNYLNNNFKEMSFSNDDLKYLAYGSGGLTKFHIDIPEKDDVDLDGYEDKNLKQASDYAILKNLTSHSSYNHGIGLPYLNAGYWLNTLSSETDRIQVCWAKVAYSQCLMDDPKIGVRPVIQVNYKENQGGGGGGSTTPSKSSTTNSGNVTLGLGITFTVLGAGGLIAFFILWSKKHPSGKPPIWIIASLAGTLVISVVGLGCLAGGMTGGAGGASCFKYGYYVEDGLRSGGGVVQVVYTAWLVKSDGTACYSSRVNDNVSASDFAPDNYMSGTYKIQGSKLIIEIPKHEIKNFGTLGGTYTYTIKSCGNFQNSDGAYHWVRGE
ncbi:MAG: hypothetical protein IJ247_07455 [Bacilli bacterium]|nr:hypothetical protein [Bacilli bacterium]